MKKVNVVLTGAIILAVASSAVAFKTAKFHTANLYYLNTSSVCKLSTNATNKPGSMGFPIHEPDFYLAILQIGSLSVCNQDVKFLQPRCIKQPLCNYKKRQKSF